MLELDPSDSQASNNLAYLLIEYRNEFDEALKYAQKAVELVLDRPAYLDTPVGLITRSVSTLPRSDTWNEPAPAIKVPPGVPPCDGYAKAGILHGAGPLGGGHEAEPQGA